MSNKVTNMQPIGGLIGDIVNRPEYGRFKKMDTLRNLWRDVCGDFISSNTVLKDYKDGVLTIFARASAFVFQLVSLKPQYMKELNNRQNEFPVRDIYFKVGNIEDPAGVRVRTNIQEIVRQAEELEAYSAELEAVSVPEEVDSSIRDFMSSLNITDGELRARIYDITRVMYKSNRYKKQKGYVECSACGLLQDKKLLKDDGICDYCDLRINKILSVNREWIVKNPHENYEAHILKFPDVRPREFNYIKHREFETAKSELDSLVKKYVIAEDAAVFSGIEKKVRFAMSLRLCKNYFEVVEFGEKNLEIMAELLGSNVRAVFVRGTMVARLNSY